MTSEQTKLHRNPPFRAEHVGSLLRPEDLLKARNGLDKGSVTDAQMEKIEDTAVNDIVDEQLKLGYHAITDGEYRRHSK